MKKFVFILALVGAANSAMAASSSTTATPDASATAATATITVPAEILAPKANKWSASAYSGTTLGRVDAAAGNADVSQTTLYVQVDRAIGEGQKVSIRPTWLQNQTAENSKNEVTYFDTYLMYSNSKYFGSTIRTNIPTGEWSREIGRHELRYDGAVDLAKAGKLTLTAVEVARRYWYTGDADGQRTWRSETDLVGTYTFNDKANVFLAPKYEASWRNSGRPVGYDLQRSKDDPENVSGVYMLELGAAFSPTKNIYIEPSIYQERDSRSTSALHLFDDASSGYELEVVLSM